METKKDTIEINCEDKLSIIYKLEKVIDDFQRELGTYHCMKQTEKDVLKNLRQLISVRDEEVNNENKKLIDFFQDKLNRYWRMTVTTYTKESSSGNITYTEEYLLYPYEISSLNHYMSCVCTGNRKACIAHEMRFENGGFMLDEFMRGHSIIEMEELSKNDFNYEIHKDIDSVLEYRLYCESNKKSFYSIE